MQAQSSSAISTNLTVHPSSTSTPVTTSSSSASVQRAETQLVAYVENTVQALGMLLETRKAIHGKPIPKGSICVQALQMNRPSIPAPIVLGNEDENSFLQTNMFFALPISRGFLRYGYLKSTNSVKLSPYAVGT